MLVSTQGELPALLVTFTGALAKAAPVAAVPVMVAELDVVLPTPPPPPQP